MLLTCSQERKKRNDEVLLIMMMTFSCLPKTGSAIPCVRTLDLFTDGHQSDVLPKHWPLIKDEVSLEDSLDLDSNGSNSNKLPMVGT